MRKSFSIQRVIGFCVALGLCRGIYYFASVSTDGLGSFGVDPHKEHLKTKALVLPEQNRDNNEEFPLPRIAYVTFGHLNSTERWIGCIHPATTYFANPYYVVMNYQWKTKYDHLVHTNESFKLHASRIQPIYTNCPESGRGWPTCCKQDQGLSNFYNHYYKDMSTNTPKYDWIGYQDDDQYIRHRPMQEFLRYLPVTSEPIVVTADAPPGHALGQTGYFNRRKTTIAPPYQCPLHNINFTYPWGQPIFYNQAAFELLMPALKANGHTKQCQEFDLNHDVGNALVNWMFGIPTVWMRNSKASPRGIDYRGDYLGVHRVTRFGSRSKMNIIHDIFERYKPYPYNYNKRPKYQWTNTTGFVQTQTYAKFGHPSTWKSLWHTFPVSDSCRQSSVIT